MKNRNYYIILLTTLLFVSCGRKESSLATEEVELSKEFVRSDDEDPSPKDENVKHRQLYRIAKKKIGYINDILKTLADGSVDRPLRKEMISELETMFVQPEAIMLYENSIEDWCLTMMDTEAHWKLKTNAKDIVDVIQRSDSLFFSVPVRVDQIPDSDVYFDFVQFFESKSFGDSQDSILVIKINQVRLE